MAFKHKIALLKIRQGTAGSTSEVTESSVVWADVSDVSVKAKANAEAVGEKLSLTAVTYQSSFDNHTHAEWSGVRYKITQSGKAENDLHIKLTLARVE